MNEKLELVLVKKYPGMFQLDNGFECDDGWFKLIDRLSYDVYAHFRKTKSGNKVIQVKEKFGGLRYYLGKPDKEVQSFVDIAQESSFNICEICGDFGKLRFGGFVRTLCDKHAKEEGYEENNKAKKTKIRSEVCSNITKKQSL